MPVTGLDHYNLRAEPALLDRLRDFYCDVVGLQQGVRPPFNSKGYWLYAGGHPILHLSTAGVDEARPAHQVNTFDHAAFRCVGFDETLARLNAAGIVYEVMTVPGTRVRQVFFSDPAGNGIELNFEGD
jgi:catechol 2,3-dioxygenase-like lactoylglutathione lyase family enzyme